MKSTKQLNRERVKSMNKQKAIKQLYIIAQWLKDNHKSDSNLQTLSLYLYPTQLENTALYIHDFIESEFKSIIQVSEVIEKGIPVYWKNKEYQVIKELDNNLEPRLAVRYSKTGFGSYLTESDLPDLFTKQLIGE
jgi:hypothetical protein